MNDFFSNLSLEFVQYKKCNANRTDISSKYAHGTQAKV